MGNRKLIISLAAVAAVSWATGMILEATDNEDLLIAKLLFFGWAVPVVVLVGLAAVAASSSRRGGRCAIGRKPGRSSFCAGSALGSALALLERLTFERRLGRAASPPSNGNLRTRRSRPASSLPPRQVTLLRGA